MRPVLLLSFREHPRAEPGPRAIVFYITRSKMVMLEVISAGTGKGEHQPPNKTLTFCHKGARSPVTFAKKSRVVGQIRKE
jgi:hypothetical protein